MFTFKISLNSEPLCHAGLSGHGALTTIISSVSRAGEDYDRIKPAGCSREEYENESTLNVGGLATSDPPDGTHLDWARRSLKEGDVIMIEICPAGPADPPVAVRPRDRKLDLKGKRSYVTRACKELGWTLIKRGKKK